MESYRAACEYDNIPVLEDIVFDINNLYVWNDVTEFNTSEISTRTCNVFDTQLFDIFLSINSNFLQNEAKINPPDWKVLFSALSYNPWFTSLVIDNLKYEKEPFTAISDLFLVNSGIQKLVIRNAQAPSSFFVTLAENFKLNEKLGLKFIDFYGNQMEVISSHKISTKTKNNSFCLG